MEGGSAAEVVGAAGGDAPAAAAGRRSRARPGSVAADRRGASRSVYSVAAGSRSAPAEGTDIELHRRLPGGAHRLSVAGVGAGHPRREAAAPRGGRARRTGESAKVGGGSSSDRRVHQRHLGQHLVGVAGRGAGHEGRAPTEEPSVSEFAAADPGQRHGADGAAVHVLEARARLQAELLRDGLAEVRARQRGAYQGAPAEARRGGARERIRNGGEEDHEQELLGKAPRRVEHRA
mmetsp:Transcript_64428/g.185140  ORF Transcript_64428/g.185140 Transcript_64428/m.185140 type:complete len:234 (+) Transcript_64428:1311-2012(+)